MATRQEIERARSELSEDDIKQMRKENSFRK